MKPIDSDGIQSAYSENHTAQDGALPAGETGSTAEDVDLDGFGLGLGRPHELIIPSSSVL